MMTAGTLQSLAMQPCIQGAERLSDAALDEGLQALQGWTLIDGRIEKTFRFADYHDTMAFVNAIAWIAHHADHHPDLSVHFNRCVVSYSTHDAGGVTRNDLVCAARVERLLA